MTAPAPLRVAVWHNLYTGGGLRALQAHVAGLLGRGHAVEAWCVGERDPAEALFGPSVRQHVVPVDRRARAGVYPNSLRLLRAMDEACARCAREMDAGGFQVALANTCQFYAVPFVLRHLRTPSVLYLQEPFRALYEADPVLPWVGSPGDTAPFGAVRATPAHLKRWLMLRAQARLEWRNVHAAGTVLVNSYYSRESVLRAYGRDARVCYLGIDAGLFRPSPGPPRPFVVGLGAVDRSKGVDDVVRAVALLDAPRPPLVWIADRRTDAYAREVQALARELGVQLDVRLRISDAELVRLLGEAAVMVYASRLEPFGLAPLEANACGTPVVAVAEGGVRESIRDGVNGILVDRDPAQLAGAMGRLLRDPEHSARLGARAAAHVRDHWGWEQSVDVLETHLLRAALTPPRQQGAAN
jgi:glycosyltransferase involved in cell wall biosynthesis